MTKYFSCFGVPRSGTTYFAHLINSHPNAYCGMEAFPPDKFNLEHLSLKKISTYAINHSAKNHAENVHVNKNIKVIGDKWPRSYYDLHTLVKNIKGNNLYFMIRNPSDVFFSFNDRASNKDDSWNEGQIWIVAYLEMLLSIYRLYQIDYDNIYFIRYEPFVGINTRLHYSEILFESLNISVTNEVERYLNLSKDRTLTSMQKIRTTSDLEKAILNLPHMQYYVEFIDCLYFDNILTVKSKISKIISQMSEDFGNHGKFLQNIAYNLCIENKRFAKFMKEMRYKYLKIYSDTPVSIIYNVIDKQIDI